MSRSRKAATKFETDTPEAADIVSSIVLTKSIKVAGEFRKVGEILTGLAPAVEAEILSKDMALWPARRCCRNRRR